MTFTSPPSSSSSASAFLPPADTMDARKAQYAAWKERMMNRTRDDEVIDLVEPVASPWSVESLFADGVGITADAPEV